ncbi:MAG: hypothetical protein R3Y24_11430 [Eubacteriales bacterium]
MDDKKQIMRLTKKGTGELIVNIVGSIGKINIERFHDSTMLANYGNIEATLSTPKEILVAIETVKEEVEELKGRDGLYVRGMIAAHELYTHILNGEKVSYKKACKVMQQVELKPVPQEQYNKVVRRINKKLEEMGYVGSVGDKVTKWLADTAIPADQVIATSDSLLHNSKKATLDKIISLPKEDGIDAVYPIQGVHWSGSSRYLGGFRGDLTFNVECPWSTPTFASIMCHEGYPGHQAFYCHWDDLFQQGKLPLEAAYYSTTGNPATAMFEGAPEMGLHFLGWDDLEEDTPEVTEEEKKLFALGRDVLDLRRMIQMQACYMYHVDDVMEVDVVKYILNSQLFTEVEARNTIRFFTHPVQRYYYPAYYYGRWMIGKAYDKIPKGKRTEFFHFLYDLPHTNETFCKGIEEMIGQEFKPFDYV